MKILPVLIVLFAAFPALAQQPDYVDVEAERKAQMSAQTSDSRFSLGKAQPSAPVVGSAVSGTSATNTGSDRGALFRQIQQLRQEVMQLNGRVEELSYEVRRLKSDNLERYKDIDRRLSGGAQVGTKPDTTAAPVAARPKASADEASAYRAAYGLVREKQFDAAIKAFRQFLVDFPAGTYAANAHYWLGELYLVVSPPDLEASRQAFTLLLDQYPGHAKEPDALFKLGKVHYLKGSPERGKVYLERLLNEYGNSGSSAVALARQFLKDNA